MWLFHFIPLFVLLSIPSFVLFLVLANTPRFVFTYKNENFSPMFLPFRRLYSENNYCNLLILARSVICIFRWKSWCSSFNGYQQIWLCDLDLVVWPTYLINFILGCIFFIAWVPKNWLCDMGVWPAGLLKILTLATRFEWYVLGLQYFAWVSVEMSREK
jgi:hypothetical protein